MAAAFLAATTLAWTRALLLLLPPALAPATQLSVGIAESEMEKGVIVELRGAYR